MAKDEIDVLEVKKRIPDPRGLHLWDFLRLFGVPFSHGVCYGKYTGYETYAWKGCGGEVEYCFNSENLCVAEDILDIIKMINSR